MQTRRLAIPAGTAFALLAIVAVAVATTPPDGATARTGGYTYRGPIASASGGAVAPSLYPSLVAVHLDRAGAALDRGEAAVDANTLAAAIPHVASASSQAAAAWAATKYIIKTTPPPPPPVGDRAGASGDGGGGLSYADPPTTSIAVLTLQHDVIARAAGMLGTNAALDTALLKAISSADKTRRNAVEYIHKVEPTPPPAGDRAGASGAAVVATFAAAMPGLLPTLDDEVQALKGSIALQKTLPAAVVTALKAAVKKAKGTAKAINTYWPPLPADD